MKRKQILVKDHLINANKWIYDGFAAAWSNLGYEVSRWSSAIPSVSNKDLMVSTFDFSPTDHNIDSLVEFLRSARKVYMYVSPTKFPLPYGSHPNFVDSISKNPKYVSKLRELENTVFWTFGNVSVGPAYYEDWGTVHTVPLAFDSIGYDRLYDANYEFDVCFVGGWADNGFNTKKKIIKDHLGAFKATDLKCGFFVNKNLTHEQECKILTNSKVCINIHDEYQRKLRLDTNERTWKSLGLNGILVSDYVGPVVPDYVYQCSTPQEMVEQVQELINNFPLALKEENIAKALKDHTYEQRCRQLENL